MQSAFRNLLLLLWYLRCTNIVPAFPSISCIPGYPQPAVQWLQDEKLLSDSGRVTIEQQEDGLCSLILADVQLSDSGVYMCRASNKLGKAVCSAKVRVET